MIDETSGQYGVKSQSHPETVYDVDMVVYTCTCLDYSSIRFCKHICAVQTHYPSVHQFIDLDQDPQEWLFDYVSPLSTPIASSTIPLPILSFPIMPSPPPLSLVEDLERLAAKMRLNSNHEPHPDLQRVITQELSLLQGSTQLLPDRLPQIAPNQRSWPETSAVMIRVPPKKTRAKRMGDPAYGAGERSAKKAKLLKLTTAGKERYSLVPHTRS